MLERKNGLPHSPAVESSQVSRAHEIVATPTYAFVRLGPKQKVRVDLPMSLKTQMLLSELVRLKKS